MKLLKFLMLPENRLPLLILTGLLILVFFLYGELGRSHRSALEAASNAKTCQELSKRIIELKKKPELISGNMSSTAQIAQSVESAMVQAEIPAGKLVRVEPRSAKRFEKTPFLEQPSHLEFREVTMEQLIRFLHTLSTQNRLETMDLRLHAPRSSASETGPEIWNAELVLTNTIYSP
ncbi:MAG: hypothetical protein LBU34_12550 [Planctomycetaceae bacterium]|jgi:hypothetical protein|nr:hypothetical protein [Planctomycetaceae bacterium]